LDACTKSGLPPAKIYRNSVNKYLADRNRPSALSQTKGEDHGFEDDQASEAQLLKRLAVPQAHVTIDDHFDRFQRLQESL
jgi:hypothetical protein